MYDALLFRPLDIRPWTVIPERGELDTRLPWALSESQAGTGRRNMGEREPTRVPGQGDAEALPLQGKSAKRGLIKMGSCEGRSRDITTSTVWPLFHHDAAFSMHNASQALHSPP